MRKNEKIKIKLAINTVVFILSAMAVDCENVAPLIICGITGAWLFLFAVANSTGGGK